MNTELKLQESDRLVELRFLGTKGNHVPDDVPSRGRETDEEIAERLSRRSKKGPSGVKIQESVQNVGLANILDDLEKAGYELVDAFHEEPYYPDTGRTKHAVRFVFARSEHATPSDEFLEVRDRMREALREVTGTAAWAVMAYRNPFFSDGEVVEGFTHVSINGAGRTPLLRPDGSPVVQWKRDETGEKVGDAPLPLTPECKLRISEDGEITIAPYEEN